MWTNSQYKSIRDGCGGLPVTAQHEPNCAARATRNYPEEAWWVAGFSEEISGTPIRRMLLDHAVVLYRGASGRVVALEDRCVHRWAPLSMGRPAGDDIVCPYHGFRFGPDGQCVHVPTQRDIPGKAKVRAFEVRESAPFVWIWMGRGEPAEALPATIDWAEDPRWLTMGAALPVDCNYMLIQENVLDLTHFGYLHATTFQQPGWTAPPSEVRTDAGRVGYRQHFTGIRLAPFQAGPTGIGPDKDVERTDWGWFMSPAIHVAGIDIVDPSPGAGRRAAFSSRIVHATTPISPTRSHYWWFFAQDYALDDAQVARDVRAIVDATFEEDKRLLEVIQETISTDVRRDQAVEVSVKADQPGLKARLMLHKMLRPAAQALSSPDMQQPAAARSPRE
nr:aromatic ring-hydroxylating dioxygenase subunit alpha [Sphingomonas chungangi]